MAKVNKSATVYASAHTEGQNPKMIYCITGFGVGNHFSSRNVRATFTNRFSVYVCLARKFVCVWIFFFSFFGAHFVLILSGEYVHGL